jgi:hypothetical protein
MMDGIFVCYHDTKKVLGFQYLSEEEMDDDVFGDRLSGNRLFRLCVLAFQHILNDMVQKMPDESLKVCLHIEQNQLKVMISGSSSKKLDGFQVDLKLVSKKSEREVPALNLYYKTCPLPSTYFENHALVPTLENLSL